MTTRFFSTAKRPPHLGPYPMERLQRGAMPDLTSVPAMKPLSFENHDDPLSIIHAMDEYQATMDAIRDGLVNRTRATCPDDPDERSKHLKAFGYFSDAAMVGVGPVPRSALLAQPVRNAGIDRLAQELKAKQVKTLASGIDTIMADLQESVQAPPSTIVDHEHALVFLYDMPRDPRADETGAAWIQHAQAHRACLRASETAVVLAEYIRLLGWDAKAHTATSTDVDLNQLTVAAGLAVVDAGKLVNPFVGDRFGVAVVTTTLPVAHDRPLRPLPEQRWLKTNAPAWWVGYGTAKSALNKDPFARRDFAKGPHPFETLKRVEQPTTYIDEAHVARVPKRADMFARAQFGDLGKAVQKAAAGGYYARKSAPSMAQRRMLGALIPFQDGPEAGQKHIATAEENAANIKATSYFLGVDAVGISRCPDWTWYSHDATGAVLDPPHDQAISMIIDQGFETMEGASGDDWISVAQSMRAYLRFSLLGGVIARQIRRMGYKAKAHTVMDGEVLQPPLLLLSGLGEVSRIGEVILNPFLGPRLKSGVVTTDMPLAHDKPIDFGLQRFCESCNKCARECPSGAITAGPKKMFNGYEIWKSDSQKCATYRITTKGGSMCGRCMKTCPWNLEGLFAEKPFRWAAMKVPKAAPVLARLDDALGNGGLKPVKKWWWDIELDQDGGYHPARAPVNARDLQVDLDLKYADQTLAVYPAPLAPPPWAYPFPMDREAGIAAYQNLISAAEYKRRRKAGETGAWAHAYAADTNDSPVVQVQVARVTHLTDKISHYLLKATDGAVLPRWDAGAHLDIVIAPDALRQYSLMGDPADRTCYEIAVLREETGKGGSRLLHRIFAEGRKVFVSRPINHFPLVRDADHSFLIGGGIGLTPMIAMAHSLHAEGRSFEVHYSVSHQKTAAFVPLLHSVPWADRVHVYNSENGTRAPLDAIFLAPRTGAHVYACGPDRYMAAVMEAAEKAGVSEEARHLEYFTVPDLPEYQNHDFTLALKDGRRIPVPADQSAAQALIAAGVAVDLKCSDGLCGVCKCGVISGEVEHRDFVLSAKQRSDQMILCQSRALQDGGELVLDL
ncbi:reductive dehalogenase [Roseobacter sp. OBYS 0001]|uniref:reductive dehalogenase n=1 Tax=Roseobacter sp. OBYS 0001 TaxID=882651 RepID=UPI001C7EFA52|nr:reductive dehalogenase [Roseobacter sp. OBYS 0001]